MSNSVLTAIIAALFTLVAALAVEVYRRGNDRDARYWEADSDYREALRAAADEFVRAARTMETHAARAVGTGAEVEGIPVKDWERFWNAHAILGLLLNDEALRALETFGEALKKAVRNENADAPVWVGLQAPRDSFLDALRHDIRQGTRLKASRSLRSRLLNILDSRLPGGARRN